MLNRDIMDPRITSKMEGQQSLAHSDRLNDSHEECLAQATLRYVQVYQLLVFLDKFGK